MPYKSDAQRRYLHAKEPALAAKWDKKYGKKVSKAHSNRTLKKVIEAGTDIGRDLIQSGPEMQKKIEEQRRRMKKRGRVKKAYEPVSDDPMFNYRAAEQAFNLVMKMDDDTAEMFTMLVVSDALETDISKNLTTIQHALDTVFDNRLEMVKKALIRTAESTDDPRVVEYAKALREVEEFTKAERNQYFYGAQFEEHNVRRGPGGRFMVKVKPTMTKPFNENQAQAIIGSYGPEKMTRAQRTRYQDEYRQVAAFLGGIGGIGQPGDVDVVYHLKDRAGNQFAQVSNSNVPPKEILENPETQLVALEAKPVGLTAGGAAYGLSGGMSGEAVARTNRIFSDKSDEGINRLSSQWDTAGSSTEQNRRLFDRLNASGAFLNTAAPPGSKAQLAGKFAQIVGQYGPEAEKVIGPGARKSAYRYRGTEKAPEDVLVSAYGREIQDAKKYGVTEAEADKRLLGFGTQRERIRGDFVGPRRTATGAKERREPGYTPSVHQMAQDRAGEAQMMLREPSWAERGQGSALVAEYLRRKLPDKHLYKLHISAGNTPPSEGVIIDSEGRLAAQAVGYGDDHYVPFNLKNLKALKGGEYIRNRSMGGLTAEDVYTGLVTGARRVTVVSRSGTFSMEFEPDFRGGRRHNDKARRMTQRYEQLLDAVQSGKVDRQNIPKIWKDAIKAEVLNDEYYRNAPKAQQQDEIEARLKEFKETPKIEGRDEDRAESMASAMEERAARGEVSDQDAKDFRTQVFNELYNMKEVRFRLNGIGYEAALKSLQEQFPYYIKDVKTRPTRDEDLLEFGLDEGYVEPGRNRPTKARAGLYGTGLEDSSKHSAALADYQRGKAGKGGFKRVDTPAGQEGSAAKAGFTDKTDTARQKANDLIAREGQRKSAGDNAVAIRDLVRRGIGDDNFVGGGSKPAFMDMNDDRFREWHGESKKNADEFHQFIEDNASRWSNTELGAGGIGGFGMAYERYKSARGKLSQQPYSRELGGHLPSTPYTFAHKPENAYHAGARPAEIDHELQQLNKKTDLLTNNKPVGELTDSEMSAEIERVKTMREMRSQGLSVDQALEANRRDHPGRPVERLREVVKDDKAMDDHLERIHQARYLREMKKQANVPPSTGFTPKQGGGGTPPAGGSPAPKDPQVPDDASSISESIVLDAKGMKEGAVRALSELDAAQRPGSNMNAEDRRWAKKDYDRVEDFAAYTNSGLSDAAIKEEYDKLPLQVQEWISGKRYYRNQKLTSS